MFYSILPTATQYARNALFAGLMPGELAKVYPEKWKNENDSGSKNLYEEFFLQENLRRLNKSLKLSYNKIVNYEDGKRLIDNVSNLMQNTLNVIVYNFVDMLSHAKTEMEVIRELADDDKAYRSLTKTWFLNSPLLEVLKKIADKKGELIITADHGLNIFKEKMNDPRNGHIPFIIYNSNFEPITIDKLVSHVDMLPTILDLIGQYDYYNEQLLGSSAFRGDKGFVFRNNDYNMQYIENNWVYSETIGINFIDNYPLHKDCTIVSPNINMLQEQCRAHVQSAFYKQKK